MGKLIESTHLSEDNSDQGEENSSNNFQLTPFLALVVSLIYMLTADGEIDDHESSQLQAVVGDHAELLEIAIEYAEDTRIEDFLIESKEILNLDDKFCILTNLCDCLLSDGVTEDHELELFRLIADSFGISQISFQAHFNNLKIKNDKKLLGTFNSESLILNGQSAHLPLACSLLYMMAADGNIADEEIGQLQVVIGEFDGLQAAAMKTVRSVKMNLFLKQASPLLTQDQKIFILLNVCDSMMADGKIDVIEDNLFQNMLTAFTVSMSNFKSYYETIRIKNIKPFDTDSAPGSFHSRVSSKNNSSRTGTFKVRHNKKLESTSTSNTPVGSDKDGGEWVSNIDQKELSSIVTRTMQDNVKQANESFAGQSDVDSVQNNAISRLQPVLPVTNEGLKTHLELAPAENKSENIQRAQENNIVSENLNLDAENVATNIQQIEISAESANRQKTVADALTANIQQIEASAAISNRQKVGALMPVTNKQSGGFDKLTSQTLALDTSSIDFNTDFVALSQSSKASDIPVIKSEDHKLKLIDAQLVLNLQSKIALVHSNLDKLVPIKLHKVLSSIASTSVHSNLKQVPFSAKKSESDAGFQGNVSLQFEELIASDSNAMSDFSESDQILENPDINLMTETVSARKSATTTVQKPTSFIKNDKKIWAIAFMVICMPLGILAKGIIYPTQTCSGLGHAERNWMPEYGDAVLIQEASLPFSNKIKFSQTQLWVDGQRFPYYKELSPKTNFALVSPTWIKGSYIDQAINKTRYTFEYDKVRQQLRIDIQSIGVGLIEGKNGLIQENSSFLGQCSNDWF